MSHEGLTQSPTLLHSAAFYFCLPLVQARRVSKNKKPPQFYCGGFVPGTGFEPAHLAAPPPEDGASTNFATRAYPFGGANIKLLFRNIQKLYALKREMFLLKITPVGKHTHAGGKHNDNYKDQQQDTGYQPDNRADPAGF